MALEFSVWPPGSVEKFRTLASEMARRDGGFSDERRADLTELAREQDLAGLTDSEVDQFITEVLAGSSMATRR